MVERQLSFALAPVLQPSFLPSMNRYACMEDGEVCLQLQGLEPDGQAMAARIHKFPDNGTLYDVNPDGSRGAPIPTLTSRAAETILSQWVHEVVEVSSERQSTAQFLTSINATMTDVLGGNMSQVRVPLRCIYVTLM